MHIFKIHLVERNGVSKQKCVLCRKHLPFITHSLMEGVIDLFFAYLQV